MHFRVAVRLGEAILLSILAGVFVWVLRGLTYPVPIVFAAFLGFLTGGVATMRTLGVTIYNRSRRMALAMVCAGLGFSATHVLDYRGFVRHQRHRQAIADYRASPREIDRRIAQELVDLTGHDGLCGYVAAAIDEGTPMLGMRLKGGVLAGFWLIELTTAVLVEARWAGGPRDPKAPRSSAHGNPSVSNRDGGAVSRPQPG